MLFRSSARLSIQTPSPIQTKCPIESFHGYLILTCGLITTRTPILAPNRRSKKTFKGENGKSLFVKNKVLTKYHKTFLMDNLSLYVYFDRSVFFISFCFIEFSIYQKPIPKSLQNVKNQAFFTIQKP